LRASVKSIHYASSGELRRRGGILTGRTEEVDRRFCESCGGAVSPTANFPSTKQSAEGILGAYEATAEAADSVATLVNSGTGRCRKPSSTALAGRKGSPPEEEDPDQQIL
jgi:hypothetical protein